MQGFYINDASWLDTAGRLLIVAFFVIVGVRNLSKFHIADHIERLTLSGTPMPAVAFWIGSVIEFVGCALLLLNWYPAVGILLLIVFTVLATALLLRFWQMGDPMKRIGLQTGFLGKSALP